MNIGKRRLLQLSAMGTVGSVALSLTPSVEAQDSDVNGSIELDDQQSDGSSITIASVSSTVDAEIRISENTPGPNEQYARITIDAGTTTENLTVELSPPIPESQPIIARLDAPGQEDPSLDEARAFVTIAEPGAGSDQYGIQLIDAAPESGFEYPYYLFTPQPDGDTEVPLLVEPNNTGTASDDFDIHRERARHTVEAGIGAEVSRALSLPLLVPVFPRPATEPVDRTHYTHQLDRETMAISEGPLERIDQQLLRMVDDAKERLSETPYTLSDRILLNGFSASGNFADRFTVLHPDRVLSVTAGGLNGMTLLPVETAKGHTLPYHIGIADVPELTGETVDLEALDEVNQFLYMGEDDTNDTIPYDGPWTEEELRETAVAVYGEDMIRDRFPFCYETYERAGISAQFKIYEGVEHTPGPARNDIIEFHRKSIEGESVDAFGEPLAEGVGGTQTTTTAQTETSGARETTGAPAESGSQTTIVDTFSGFGAGAAIGALTGGGVGYLLNGMRSAPDEETTTQDD